MPAPRSITAQASTASGNIDIEGAVSGNYVYFQTAGGGGFTQGANATINSGSSALTISADSVNLTGAAGSITGTSNAYIYPVTSGTSIGIGTGAGSLSLPETALSTLVNFSYLSIGTYNTGPVTLSGSIVLPSSTTITANTGGAITLASTTAVSVPTGQSLALNTSGTATLSAGSTISAGSLNVSAGSIAYATTFTPTATGANDASISLYSSTTGGSLTVASPITAGSRPLDVTIQGYYANTITIANNITTNNGSFNLSSYNVGNFVETAGTTIDTGTTSLQIRGQPQIDIEGAINGQYVYFQTAAGGSFTQGANATIDAGASYFTIAADSVSLNGAAGSITGTSNAYIYPVTSGTSVGIGTGSGSLSLPQTALSTLASFSSLSIGTYNTGPVTLDGRIVLPTGTTITANDTGGTITLAQTAAVSLPTGQGLTLTTAGTATLSAGSTISAGSLSVSAGNIAYATAFSPTAVSTNYSNLSLYSSATGGSLTIDSPITAGSTPLNVTIQGYYGNAITIANNITTNNGNISFYSYSGGNFVESLGQA